jgi:hypothetical protein
MSKQVSIKNLDLKKLSYSAPVKGKNGGKVISLLNNGETLKIQMPKMAMPFGASDYNGNKKYSINFSFDMNLESHKKAFDILKDLDTKLIKDAAANSMEWFGIERSVGGVKETFQSQLKVPVDSKYPPRIKAGLMTSNGTSAFRCNFVDMEGNKISVNQENVYDMIPGRSTGTAILECVGIWIVLKSLTLTWKVSKMKYEKGANDDLDFDSDSDSDTPSTPSTPAKTEPVKITPTVLESEESSGESDKDEEPPTPVVLKKVSKSKKALVEITPTVMESEESGGESDKEPEPPTPVVLKRVSSKAKKALAV